MSTSTSLTIAIRPVVVISKCLDFEPCRYDGKMIAFDFGRVLRDHVTFVPICPEVEIGLGTPRDPIKIVRRLNDLCLFQLSTGRDISAEMHSFSDNFLNLTTEVDGFILKSRSPSCGINDAKVFAENSEEPEYRKTAGFFGRAVLERHNGLAIEDEFRLADLRTRDHWLTKLFLHARFRRAKESGSIDSLANFHDENRMLFLAHEQFVTRKLDLIASNTANLSESVLWAMYSQLMFEALKKPMRNSPQVNALSWAMGQFRDHLSSDEKREYLNMLAQFQAGKLSRFIVFDRLHLWIARYNNEFLRRQSYFCPYPIELMNPPGKRVQ